MSRFTFTNNGIRFVADSDTETVSIRAIDSEGFQFQLVYPEGDTLSTFEFSHPLGKSLIFEPGELPAVWDRAANAFNCSF